MLDTLIDGEIERRRFTSAYEFEQHLKAANAPVILTHQMDDWPALRRWTLAHFATAYGHVPLTMSADLPDRGAVYDQPDSRHTRVMKLSDIMQLIEHPGARPCYAHQRPIQLFPGAEQEVRFEDIVRPQVGTTPSVNIWIGSGGTRSGLHFDRRDNLLAQIQGKKAILVCPPAEASGLYPFPGNVEKSRVDIENPDFAEFPRLRQCRFRHATLQPGEILFIPRMWWHFVRSLEPALSINYWFGEHVAIGSILNVINQGGVPCWTRVMRDFVSYGVLGLQPRSQLFSDTPTGKMLYEFLAGAVKRRLPRL